MEDIFLEFKKIILGSATVAEFWAAMLFAGLTALAMILSRVTERNKESELTPNRFSWEFYWDDNRRHNFGAFILIFILIRISQYWIKPGNIIYVAVVIGLISDQIAMLFLKVKHKTTKFLSDKIDNVDIKVGKVNVKVEDVKGDTVDIKKDVDEMKDSINDLKNKTP